MRKQATQISAGHIDANGTFSVERRLLIEWPYVAGPTPPPVKKHLGEMAVDAAVDIEALSLNPQEAYNGFEEQLAVHRRLVAASLKAIEDRRGRHPDE